MNEEGVSGLLQRVSSLSYGYEGRLELHLVGAFADTKGIAAALLHSALSKRNQSITLVNLDNEILGGNFFSTSE